MVSKHGAAAGSGAPKNYQNTLKHELSALAARRVNELPIKTCGVSRCCRPALLGFGGRAEPLLLQMKLGSFCKVADRSRLVRCSELIYFRAGFFKRTPSPPPFSSMNSMPAFSSARFNLTLVSSVT